MADLGNEYTLVELPAIEYLRDVLGYKNYIYGEKLTPAYGERESMRDVVLLSRLEKAIKRLNPWINEISLARVKKIFTNSDNLGASLLEINEQIHKYIVDLEFTVTQGINAKPQTVKFIDFENPDNNDYLITNQFEVQGVNNVCFPDIVIFINGIPVVVIEAKSPFKEKSEGMREGKKDAYEQLRRYMNLRGTMINEGIEKLFHTNFFTGIINKYKAYVGTISSTYDYYLEWKDPYPFKKEDLGDIENNGQNLFLHGMLEKSNLLKIMQFFILYETEGDTRIKKIARYQQFRACMKALERVKKGKTPLEKGGVIWHTQGSGKSLSMAMLARMIRRTKELQDSMLVIITDRVDLDKQIHETFKRVFPKEYTIAVSNLDKLLTRAEKVEEMKILLSAGQAKIIMTTIQKFQCKSEENPILEDNETKEKLFFDKEIEVLTNKSNVIVFTDEAHRSQYSNLSVNMRKALPNATFIGFTGTPIEKDDKSTYKTFGKLIDSYTISEAVKDGNTVAIVYEGRKEELHIITDKLDEDFNEYFKDKSDDEKEAIKQKYFTKIALAEADDRIDEIAKDMLIHYRDNSYKQGFKAQIVTVSRHACVKYYNAIQKHMTEVFPDNPIEAKVIFSCENNEEPFLKDHRTLKSEQDLLLDRFKKEIEKDRLCIIIVKDMLLTGFDAKIEDVMYLDRPLKEHTLLQAIARVNRTYSKEIKELSETGEEIIRTKTKTYGYVVDYFGVTTHLKEALELFDNVDITDSMENIGSVFNKMLDYKEAVLRIFVGVDKSNLDALMNVLKPDNIRAEFDMAYKRFATTLNALMPNHVRQEDLNDLKWLSYIRAAAKARFEPEIAIDISDCGEKAKELISKHLRAEGVTQWIQPITLFEKDFKEKMNSLQSDEAIASSMEHAIKHAINVKMKENPVHYTSLLEKLVRMLEERKMTWEERRRVLEEFVSREFSQGEETLAKDLGLESKRQLALYETIQNIMEKNAVRDDVAYYNGESKEDIIKKMTLSIEGKILSKKGFRNFQQEVETAIFDMLLSEHYDDFGDYDKITQVTQAILELAEIHYTDME